MKPTLEQRLKNPAIVCLVAGLCCLLWGSAFPFIKIGYRLLGVSGDDYMSQILFAGLRFTLAGVITDVIGSAMSKSVLKISRGGYHRVALLALFQTVGQYIFFYIGLARATGTRGSIINSVSVFFTVLIATLILRQEKLTANKIIGCVSGFVGVVLVNITGATSDTAVSLGGEGFIVLSSLSYAISSVLIKRFSRNESPVALSGYQFILGGIVMSVVGFAFGGRLSFTHAKSVLLLLYLALLSAVAYTLWGVLLKYNPVSRVSVFGFMTPVFGFILSALLLGEGIADGGIKAIIALALVCVGIYLVNKEKKYESKNDTSQRF